MPPKNIAGAPARGPDFWGREQDVKAVWRLLERGSVLLAAPRRWGKSSLMFALHDDPWPTWRVLQLDVEYVETPAEFLTELTAALLQLDPVTRVLRKAKSLPGSLMRWLSDSISDIELGALQGVGEVKLKLRESLTNSQHWPELTEQLLEQLRKVDGSMLLIIDEFPMMLANFLERDPQACLHFLRWFRAQRRPQNGPTLRFLLGGSINIEPRLEQLAQEAVLNDLERFYLRPLSTERAVAFVTEVLKGEGARFEEGVPRKMVEVVGIGVHYFLQVLISECLSEMRQHGRALKVDEIPSIYESRVLGPSNRARFSHYHSRLRTNYGPMEEPARIVLAELTRNPECNMEQLQQRLHANNQGGQVRLDELIARLESDYYVTRDGSRVRFQSNFLRDWWLRNAPGHRRTS